MSMMKNLRRGKWAGELPILPTCAPLVVVSSLLQLEWLSIAPEVIEGRDSSSQQSYRDNSLA